MNNRRPNPGECYRHFKGNCYQVMAIAKHTETEEELVIYRRTDGGEGSPVYARPLDMFMSRTDKEKFPDAVQEYRFELQEDTAVADENEQNLILQFLDLASSREKAAFLQGHKQEMTDNFLAAAAHSLDMTESQITLELRYQDILHVLKARMKYEKR